MKKNMSCKNCLKIQSCTGNWIQELRTKNFKTYWFW